MRHSNVDHGPATCDPVLLLCLKLQTARRRTARPASAKAASSITGFCGGPFSVACACGVCDGARNPAAVAALHANCVCHGGRNPAALHANKIVIGCVCVCSFCYLLLYNFFSDSFVS
jgi:hypothetical protein